MKYCEEYAALLDLFVDGELPPGEMERVRTHLADCPGCQAYVDDALTIRAGFPDAEETVVPEGFVEGVMERIQAAPAGGEEKRRAFRRWMGTAAALAACCALVVLVQSGTGGALKDSPAATTRAAAPSGYDGAAEADIAPRMADTAEPAEESAEPFTAAKESGHGGIAGDSAAGEPEGQQRSALAAAPPAMTEAAASSDKENASNSSDYYKEIALCLTAREAGDLLDGFVPEQEDASERRYTLNLEEYEALLEALGRWEKLPDTPEMRFQVVVTGPFK